jgi:hypothetical protein
MKYKVIYEYTSSESVFIHGIILTSLLCIGIMLVIVIRKNIKSYSIIRQLFIFFGYALGTLSLIMLVVYIIGIPEIKSNRNKIEGLIEKKEYMTIEGKIENLELQEESGHIFESFIVKGIFFKYSDYIINEGFHQTSKKNGPIKMNGQLVRIYYITKDNQNIILKLELADTTSNHY